MRPMVLLVMALGLWGCEPRQPRMSVEDRAITTCQRMGLSPGQPTYPDCVTRMIQTYVQADTADMTSRRAAAARMYRAPQTIQVQQAPPPGGYGSFTPVTVPPLYPR